MIQELKDEPDYLNNGKAVECPICKDVYTDESISPYRKGAPSVCDKCRTGTITGQELPITIK